jgi:nitric oxide reductase NorE protein
VSTDGVARPARRELPGDADIWVFVLGDMLIFSAYFAAYLFLDRGQNQAQFLQAQQQLSQGLGITNTLVLLTSSLLVAMCVQTAKEGNTEAASRLLTAAGSLGVVFLLIKLFEWYTKIRSGLTVSSNAFFMHYYMLTGLHLMHVLVGLVFLGILRLELQRTAAPRVKLLEAGGIYWHMVDFLWIIIFALLYLMR